MRYPATIRRPIMPIPAQEICSQNAVHRVSIPRRSRACLSTHRTLQTRLAFLAVAALIAWAEPPSAAAQQAAERSGKQVVDQV